VNLTMSAYDLEEQEQLAELKAWWKLYGNLIVAAFLAAALVFAGWRGWHWHQGSQSTQASATYSELQKAAAAKDLKKVRDLAGALIEDHPRTLYASLGALVSAKTHFAAGDLKTARAQLQWVAEHARDSGVQTIARLRLGSVMLDEKAYDDALKLLAAKPDPAFEFLVDDLRGDILVAQGKRAEARAAYQAALSKVAPNNDAARELIQLKLDSLGSGG
jgi:predicted negative regulator of RcsB-dependent stress response